MEPCGLVPVKALPPPEVLEQLREEQELLAESGLAHSAQVEPCRLVPVKALPPPEVLEQLREEEELLRESGLPDAAPVSCDQRTATFPSPSETSQQLQALARNRAFRWGACPDHPRCSLQPHLSESETSALYGELRLRSASFGSWTFASVEHAGFGGLCPLIECLRYPLICGQNMQQWVCLWLVLLAGIGSMEK